jgi:hypothetical protein
VDGEDCIAPVIWAREPELEFLAGELPLGSLEFGPNRRLDGLVALGNGEFQEFGSVDDAPVQLSPGRNLLTDRGEPLHHLTCLIGVIPEAGVAGLFFEVYEVGCRLSDVKGAP